MDCIVHGIATNQTQLSNFHSHNYMKYKIKLNFLKIDTKTQTRDFHGGPMVDSGLPLLGAQV